MKNIKEQIKKEIEEIIEDKGFIEETRHEVVKSSIIPAVSLVVSTSFGVIAAVGCKKIFKL